MNGLRLFALLVYSFGAFTYGALLVLWVRELGRVGWGGRGGDGATPADRRVDLLNGALTIVSFAWFLVLIAEQLLLLAGARQPYWPLAVANILLAFSFPPLIMHVTWAEASRRHRIVAAALWRALIATAYVLAALLPAAFLYYSLLPAWDAAQMVAIRLLNAGLSVLFIAAAVFAMALISRTPKATRTAEGGRHWSMVTLFGVMLLIFATIFIIGELQGGGPMYPIGSLLEVVAKSLPLIFIFVSTYYENRFQFFDIFVKRGFSLLVAVGVLTVWFAVTLPMLAPIAAGEAAPWIFAITLLPILVVAAWIQGQVGRLLDRRWLGRRYSTVEAVTRFLASLRSATSEEDAVGRAEISLGEIFGAPAAVVLDAAPPAPFDVRHETVVVTPEGVTARVRLGPRASDAPYFSEDTALLRSLADVFGSVVDNLRLQQRRQELSLSASRSELKALRAQINPHFLFNALNAIAGLLHRDPSAADRTIEKLADVFRYTLRGSESEWAVLEQEIEFVRAYLDVEQARFGNRLDVTVTADDAARRAQVPTMIVQTLVENAVKHGVAAVRGRAAIEVRATVHDGRLEVLVADNGPGFRDDAARQSKRQGGGFGLVNVRQRLAGHFGASASLDTSRNEATGRTEVRVRLPLVAEPARAAGASR